ncbi:hypothetical protein EVAR_34383_1 [Eumeta japonica]|uniref:Uncharacterized protein n=1 Tax=Eumeta variegata TaxID=151549 RepID=A0A4C1YRN9_EUMVA|nr:hypothetical protein EVAR_34383_1 [Eumeta japonica]
MLQSRSYLAIVCGKFVGLTAASIGRSRFATDTIRQIKQKELISKTTNPFSDLHIAIVVMENGMGTVMEMGTNTPRIDSHLQLSLG